MRTAFLFAFLSLWFQGRGAGPQDKPFPPHKVIGNIYYVGTDLHCAFLITTPEGHILINSTYERTVPIVQKAIEQLGFKFQDVKIVDKPWGREVWYAHTPDYAGKLLEVSAGKRLSLQKHEIKGRC